MGAHPYWYFTAHEADFDAALQKLRRREFEAGRYNPVEPFIEFPVGPASRAPGAEHASIDDARQAAPEEGTRSILDIDSVGEPSDFGVAAPLDDDALQDLFGTNQPTRQMIEANMDFFDQIDRGQAIYLVVYREGKRDELFFAGYSFD